MLGRSRAQGLAEFAVTAVVMLMLVVSVVDTALWLNAQSIVVAASQHAAAVGSREDGTAGAAEQAAWDFLRSGLGAGLTGITLVQVRLDADTATAEVRGTWPVAPLGSLVRVPVHATTSIVRDRFRPGGR